jgi:50S ribosomal subunit-associated GTPase HflX
MNAEFVLTDTMGIVAGLPEVVREAFQMSQQDELASADVLLHVSDVSDPLFKKRQDIVLQELANMGLGDKLLVTVLNQKTKAVSVSPAVRGRVAVLPYTPSGGPFCDYDNERCVHHLQQAFGAFMAEVDLTFPYFRTSTWTCLNSMFRLGNLLDVTYDDAGVKVRGRVPKQLLREIEQAQRRLEVDSGLMQQQSGAVPRCRN